MSTTGHIAGAARCRGRSNSTSGDNGKRRTFFATVHRRRQDAQREFTRRLSQSDAPGHDLYSIVAIALGTGMRRGELLAVRWSDTDLNGPTVRFERSLEETKEGLRFKAPKSKRGRRTISLPPCVVAVRREHRRKHLELRVA